MYSLIKPYDLVSTGIGRNSEMKKELLTVPDAAEALAVKIPTVRKMISDKRIGVVRVGRCVRIKE
jgi:excisionase family DNA binding protein